jgi:NTP pyrophosphatase (non-canonical NTP hydrolase)
VEAPNLNPGPYSIGSDHFPGTAKLLEEMGELQQALGKLIALGHMGEHWDGSNLRERLEEEIADVMGAIWFFADKNGLNEETILERAKVKELRFQEWHGKQVG